MASLLPHLAPPLRLQSDEDVPDFHRPLCGATPRPNRTKAHRATRRLPRRRSRLRHRPLGRPHLGLLQHRLRRLLLFVGRVAVLAQDSFHEDSKVRADVVSHRPVDRDVLSHRLRQLPGDALERRLAQHLHGAVVRPASIWPHPSQKQLFQPLGRAARICALGALAIEGESNEADQIQDHVRLERLDS